MQIKLFFRLTKLMCFLGLLILATSLLARIVRKAMASPSCIIMIDPAGEAMRDIDGTFERGITLQCAQQLKKIIEQRYPSVRVVLTRLPGEESQPLQHANFANRLGVDFFISLHFYQEQEIRPQLCTYQLSYYNAAYAIKRQINQKQETLTFIPYNQVHLRYEDTSKVLAQQLGLVLKKSEYEKKFIYQGHYCIPCKLLMGIQAPALVLEAGLKNHADWQDYIEPIADALGAVIQEIQRQKISPEV